MDGTPQVPNHTAVCVHTDLPGETPAHIREPGWIRGIC